MIAGCAKRHRGECSSFPTPLMRDINTLCTARTEKGYPTRGSREGLGNINQAAFFLCIPWRQSSSSSYNSAPQKGFRPCAKFSRTGPAKEIFIPSLLSYILKRLLAAPVRIRILHPARSSCLGLRPLFARTPAAWGSAGRPDIARHWSLSNGCRICHKDPWQTMSYT